MRNRTKADNLLFNLELKEELIGTTVEEEGKIKRLKRKMRQHLLLNSLSSPQLIKRRKKWSVMVMVRDKSDVLWKIMLHSLHLITSATLQLVVNAANMEMKSALIHLVQSNQFTELSHENPYTHGHFFGDM